MMQKTNNGWLSAKTDSLGHIGSLLLVILIGFALRLHYLNRLMLFDEATTVVLYASKGFFEIITNYSLPNNHILHSLLVHFMQQIAGLDPMIVRLPAFAAGVLIIPLTYQVSYRVYHVRSRALLAASLAMAWPALIDYSVNARGYSLIACLTLLLIWLGYFLKTGGSPKQWLLFVVVLVLGFYTIPIMFFPAGMVALWLLISIIVENEGSKRKQLLVQFFVAIGAGGMLTLLVYTPVIMVSGLDSLAGNPYVSASTPGSFYPAFPDVLRNIILFINWGLPDLLGIIGVLFVFVAIVFRRGLYFYRSRWLLSAGCWIVSALLLMRVSPFPRTWLFLIPLYLAMLAAGITYVGQLLSRRLSSHPISPTYVNILIILIGLLLASQVISSKVVPAHSETSRADSAEAMAFYLNDTLQDDDVLVGADPSDMSVYYYLMLHDFDQAFDQKRSLDEALSHATGYVYFPAHRQNELDFIAFALGDVVYEAEVIHEFPFGVVMRLPRNQLPVE